MSDGYVRSVVSVHKRWHAQYREQGTCYTNLETRFDQVHCLEAGDILPDYVHDDNPRKNMDILFQPGFA